MAELTYDDRMLERLYDAMDLKKRYQSLSGAMRKTMGKVRKTAQSYLRQTSSVKDPGRIVKNVQPRMFKRSKSGFSITVHPGRTSTNAHLTSGYIPKTTRGRKIEGRKLPIAMWVSTSTKSAGRGSTKKYRIKKDGYMDKTKNQMETQVTAEWRSLVASEIQRVSRKYGCS